jgi:hypothetical protein
MEIKTNVKAGGTKRPDEEANRNQTVARGLKV